MHPWWRADIQLSNTFEYDFRWEFFAVRFRLNSDYLLSQKVQIKVYALYVYHFRCQRLAFVFMYIIKCVTFSLCVRIIDLFGLYILFSQYRSCDNTQEAWSFVLFIKKSACIHHILLVTLNFLVHLITEYFRVIFSLRT